MPLNFEKRNSESETEMVETKSGEPSQSPAETEYNDELDEGLSPIRVAAVGSALGKDSQQSSVLWRTT